VLELASVLAGPLAGSFLSELGATVIKVENKITNGDVTRKWKNVYENESDPISSYYASANYSKKALLLDFNNHSDRVKLEDLIESSDIIISNLQKRVGEKFDIDPYTLNKKYPDKIIAQLDAYSYDDPRPAYDMVMQADVGYISMCGTEDDLAKIPVAMMDVLAAHQLKQGILLSIISKMLDGKGSIVFTSLYKSAVSGLVNQASNFLNEGLVAKPVGTLHPNIAPYGDLLITSDQQKIMLVIGSDQQFFSLMEAFGLQDKLSLYDTNSKRLKKRNELIMLLNSVSSEIGFEKLISLLVNRGLPYGIIKNLKESLNSKEAEEMIIHNNDGKRTIKNIAFELF
jgi:crotonobetainyl-CoA:carnitine CoA-transferase CaiB-like acyl-CoA transferase